MSKSTRVKQKARQIEHLSSIGDPPTQLSTSVPIERDPGEGDLGDGEEDHQAIKTITEKGASRLRQSGTQSVLIVSNQRSARSEHSNTTPRRGETEDLVGDDEIEREFSLINTARTLADELQKDYKSVHSTEPIHPDVLL
ncbi:hypothetical protein BDN67DRAFT_1016655 [Paxillus ammoniavirescens]|nr:hypothetical protein BDN67DRAFT_1016655 [Paxillus ammoniavirescens]